MTQQPKGSAPDPIGDLQRWLLRSGVRGVSRGVSGQVRTMFGGGRTTTDVWEAATTPPPEEAPECAWCPICRAARMMRSSGPGLASHMAAAGDTLATAVLEAVSTVESALAAAQRAAAENGAGTRSGPGQGGPRARTASPPDSWGAVTAEKETGEQAGAAPREPGPAATPPTVAGGEDPAGQPAEAPPQPSAGSPREPDDRG